MVRKIAFWVSTVLLSLMMLMSGGMMLMMSMHPDMAAKSGQVDLGYPWYFGYLLGTAKLLGVLALWIPISKTVKQWAYAGFTFTFLAAAFSHVMMKDAAHAPGPLFALALLALSYFTHPKLNRA